MRYEGIAPTGPLPEQINFPLIKREESQQFGDLLQIRSRKPSENSTIFVTMWSQNSWHGYACGMTMGDIMYDDLSLFPRYNALMADRHTLVQRARLTAN